MLRRRLHVDRLGVDLRLRRSGRQSGSRLRGPPAQVIAELEDRVHDGDEGCDVPPDERDRDLRQTIATSGPGKPSDRKKGRERLTQKAK